MTNRHQKRHQQIAMTSILDRLPLQRQLSLSQAMLIKLTPSWQRWRNKHFTTQATNNVLLTNYEDNTLTIHCSDAISASQVKHQQHSLLNYFHSQGFTELERINIRISNPTHSALNNSLERSNSPERNNSPEQPKFQSPSIETLKSIQACEKIVSNDQLANSLKKLAQTLKSNAKQ